MNEGQTGRQTGGIDLTCMVCDPPERVAGRFEQADGSLERLPYCARHGPADLRIAPPAAVRDVEVAHMVKESADALHALHSKLSTMMEEIAEEGANAGV